MNRPDPEFFNPHKTTSGWRRIVRALLHSVSGLRLAFAGEAAFRQELALAVVLIPVALALSVSRMEKALLVSSVLTVLCVELLNSAVEASVDRVSLELHPLSKRAKDLGSAAVLLAFLYMAAVWTIILWPS